MNLLAAAAPMIVGLSAIGAALAVADRHIQTKKLAKVALVNDVVCTSCMSQLGGDSKWRAH